MACILLGGSDWEDFSYRLARIDHKNSSTKKLERMAENYEQHEREINALPLWKRVPYSLFGMWAEGRGAYRAVRDILDKRKKGVGE